MLFRSGGSLKISFSFDGVKATWNDDMTTITFTPNTGIFAAINADGEYSGYGWAGAYNVTMTKVVN